MRGRIVAAFLVPTVVGCTTFGPVSARDYIIAKRPPQVWVTGQDGSVVVLERPSFAGDTLTGFVRDKYQEILTEQIRVVRARRAAPGRTALLVVSSIAVVGAGAILVHGTGKCTPVGQPGTDESQLC